MRIFWAFLIVLTAALLWLVPITDVIYSFRTDVRNDNFNIVTAVGETATNVTLQKVIYNNDVTTLSVISSDDADTPLVTSYNGTTHTAYTTGLSDNLTRTLTYTYDVDALNASAAWTAILDKIPLIWMIIIIAFAPAGLVAIFTGRA